MRLPEPVNPGLRRHRIAIKKRPDATAGTYGSTEIDWDEATLKGYYWAEMIALQGRELQAAQQSWAEARFRFKLQYLADVDRADRIEIGGRTFDILDAEDPTGHRRELHILCRELVD